MEYRLIYVSVSSPKSVISVFPEFSLGLLVDIRMCIWERHSSARTCWFLIWTHWLGSCQESTRHLHTQACLVHWTQWDDGVSELNEKEQLSQDWSLSYTERFYHDFRWGLKYFNWLGMTRWVWTEPSQKKPSISEYSFDSVWKNRFIDHNKCCTQAQFV